MNFLELYSKFIVLVTEFLRVFGMWWACGIIIMFCPMWFHKWTIFSKARSLSTSHYYWKPDTWLVIGPQNQEKMCVIEDTGQSTICRKWMCNHGSEATCNCSLLYGRSFALNLTTRLMWYLKAPMWNTCLRKGLQLAMRCTGETLGNASNQEKRIALNNSSSLQICIRLFLSHYSAHPSPATRKRCVM